MNSDGGNITRITYTDFHHHIFGISKDKTYIIATRSVEDTNGDGKVNDADGKSLWLIDLIGGTDTLLTDLSNQAEGRTFSPDGAWVTFWMLKQGDSQSDIYKIRIDGTELTNLTNTFGPGQNEFDPAWSHGGGKIAFIQWSTAVNRMTLKSMNTDGSNIVQIFDSPEGVDTPIFKNGAYDPAWSHDDEWIVFDKPMLFTGDGENFFAGVWHIFKVASDGRGTSLNLSIAGGHSIQAEYLPSFSAVDSSIVFSSRYQNQIDINNSYIDIFTMNASTGVIEKRLTTTGTTFYDMFGIYTQ